MSENKSPVEGMMPELQAARAELNKVEAARNEAMRTWAATREALQGTRPQVELQRRFEKQTTVMTELNTRFVEAQRRVREVQNAMRQGHQRWARERGLELYRSHAA